MAPTNDEPSGPSVPFEEGVLKMLYDFTMRLEQVQHDVSILQDMVAAIE